MPESDDREQDQPTGPGHIPSGFHPTVIRAQSLQAEKGLGVRATIMPDDLDGEVVVDPSETAHIPMEELARDGRQVIFDEAGQIDLGPQTACPAYEVREVLGRGGMGWPGSRTRSSQAVAPGAIRKIPPSRRSTRTPRPWLTAG